MKWVVLYKRGYRIKPQWEGESGETDRDRDSDAKEWQRDNGEEGKTETETDAFRLWRQNEMGSNVHDAGSSSHSTHLRTSELNIQRRGGCLISGVQRLLVRWGPLFHQALVCSEMALTFWTDWCFDFSAVYSSHLLSKSVMFQVLGRLHGLNIGTM